MPSCTYLGLVMDNKLTFIHQVQKLKTELGRHCGVVSKKLGIVSKCVLLKYYNANIKPIVHYGLLVYVGTSISILNQVLLYQRKTNSDIFQKKIKHYNQKFL